ISERSNPDNIRIEFEGVPWAATLNFLTPSTAGNLYNQGLQKLKNIKPPQTPSILDRLGKARPVFKSMLQFGEVVSEVQSSGSLSFHGISG
ncbi:hypothetical protein RSAG8_09353, partial [Rhizoctonia solani AG-8 WAC10335]